MLSKLRKVSLLTIVMVLAAFVFIKPVEAQKLQIPKGALTNITSAADKRALVLPQGKYNLQVSKKGHGYVKFVAPVAGKYNLTISNLKKFKKHHLPYAYCCLQTTGTNPSYIQVMDAKTYGGKHHILYFNTKNINKGTKIYRYRKTRTGQVTLKAGQAVYMYFHCKKKDSFKLAITKV